ncbi:MAG: TROVE domain-containing protein [Patescibacteria group bacterium]|nr:TROVE domain-containing protein [Patescibacteria group bacterium]
MKTNVKHASAEKTHEGGMSSKQLSPAQQLRRTVMACMLFEDSFYESGVDSVTRIRELIKKVSFEDAAQIALDARTRMKLRHAPLLILREVLRLHSGRKVGDLIFEVIQRPDELGELLALYWQDGQDQPLTAQLKIGLARALKKFDEYQLAKWNKDGAVKLRDVLFLSHARPENEMREALFKKIAQDELQTPDTWEVSLSGGANKKETFERLIAEKKLGALALLRNLRGMGETGVDRDVMREAVRNIKVERVLPFRFISAARYAPWLEPELEQAMFKCLEGSDRFSGNTVLLVDHSGSMGDRVSGKSEITRFDAACGVAMILREVCENVRIFGFSDRAVEVAPRRGFALKDALTNCMSSGGTYLGQALRQVQAAAPECERIIVITDEQSADRPSHPNGKGYIVNIAGYKNGIGYGPWITIDGWSEAVIDYIREFEKDAG